MGIGSSEQSRESLLDKLQYVQTAQDDHFGRVEIFKCKEVPYDYMMKYVKSFRDRDSQFEAEA
jgi:hypothetical protein